MPSPLWLGALHPSSFMAVLPLDLPFFYSFLSICELRNRFPNLYNYQKKGEATKGKVEAGAPFGWLHLILLLWPANPSQRPIHATKPEGKETSSCSHSMLAILLTDFLWIQQIMHPLSLRLESIMHECFLGKCLPALL